MADLSEKDVFRKTIYAEARGEPKKGQIWVAWVIKNRARLNKSYWGGSSIKGVCLKADQFECWNGRNDISIGEPEVYKKICTLADDIYGQSDAKDPTGGADHYHNPHKEGRDKDWIKKCDFIDTIGNHDFYKTKKQYL